MSNAERLLRALDQRLNHPVELTLYGRAALQLGFSDPPADFAASRDIDAVLSLGEAEQLAGTSNFWQAIEDVNQELSDQELYISHLFEEDQVVLLPDWREHRVKLALSLQRLSPYRLGDLDLFLTKLMRDDPLDRADARFIIERAGLSRDQLREAIRMARVPDIPELREQFAICSSRYL